MRTRVSEVVTALRARGVRVSVAEAIDAIEAVATLHPERALLAEALAATLVKDERDRPVFDDVFDRVFPARGVGPAAGKDRRRSAGAMAGGDAATGAAAGGGAGAAQPRAEGRASGSSPGRPSGRVGVADADRERSTAGDDAADHERPAGGASRDTTDSDGHTRPTHGADDDRASPRTERPAERSAASTRARGEDDQARAGGGDAERDDDPALARVGRLRREGELRDVEFRALTPQQVEEAEPIVRELARRFRARVRRRLEPRRRGRLDFRRTLRAAVPRGGVAFERFHRGRRRDRPSLVALCDLSGSVATSSDVLLSILAPAAEHFAHARFFGFVDRLVEIEFVDGQVRPAGPIDLMAHSDFGRVLADLAAGPMDELGADTVVLVLGDARNNRRPPRADVLADVRSRVRRVLWLNPDPVPRWDTGDSVIGVYARHADAVLPAATLRELEVALRAVARV
jgi:uncharacterized protein